MFKGQTLRVCVKEEDDQWDRRHQRPPDPALSAQARLHGKQAVQMERSSPESRVKEEIPESPQIKEEAEEQSLKQEEELLPEFTAVCVKSEEPSSLLQQRQTEAREEAQGEQCGGARPHVSTAHTHGHFHSLTDQQTDHSSDTDNDEDWEPPASTSTAHMETEEHRDHYGQGQRRDTSPTAHNSGVFSKSKCGAESRAAGPEGPLSGTAGGGGGERKYECFVCKKRFASKLHLTIHIRVHTGEKPYSCSMCMKTFAQKGNLTAHMKTHTGEKPYSCSICEKSFARMSMLNRHIQVHTGDKPYSCSVCKKAFSQKFDMDVHMRSHSSEHFYMGPGGGGVSWFGGVSSVQTEPIDSVEIHPPRV